MSRDFSWKWDRAPRLRRSHVARQPQRQLQEPSVISAPARSSAPARTSALIALIEEVTGIDLAGKDLRSTFVELGLDSLLLTQLVIQIHKHFSVKLTFRQLMENYH